MNDDADFETPKPLDRDPFTEGWKPGKGDNGGDDNE
jgi:hypothetical protein